MRTQLEINIRHCMAAIVVGGLSAQRASASPCDLTQVTYCTWAGNNFGFAGFDDTVATISFETLPDGTPSHGGVPITPAFNYVLQGAMFTTPFSSPTIGGNTQLGYALDAFTSSPIAQNSIIAQLTQPEQGVGVYVIGHTTLRVYDTQGALIATTSFFGFGQEYFLGVRSNIPIARAVVDNGSNFISIDDFTMIHISVPEPATASLLLLAVPLLLRRAALRSRM